MEQQLQDLVEKARSGESEPFQELVGALRSQGYESSRHWLTLLQSPDAVLRRAGLSLIEGELDLDLLAALTRLTTDSESTVRLALAELLSTWPDSTLNESVAQLLVDADSEVRRAAVRAASKRAALEPQLIERLLVDEYWRVRQEIARALARAASLSALPVLLRCLAEDGDTDVQAECAASLEAHLVRLGTYPTQLGKPRYPSIREAYSRTGRLRNGFCPTLIAWLEVRVNTDVDLDLLRTFGTVLTLEAESGKLPRAYEVDHSVEEVMKILQGEAPRAAVLVGESGCGKTAIIYELVYRLRQIPDQPWYVLRVAPSEFLAGTTYLGEWETKLRNLVAAIRHPRPVVLYIPNLEELTSIGVSSKSDSNVANALAPAIEHGEIVILGESTPEAFRKGLGAVRSLRRLFHSIQVPTTEAEETREILRAVAEESGIDVAETVLDRLTELADYYVSGTVQPGRTVGLFRRVVGTLGGVTTLSERQVLHTLSSSTGIPADFLDDALPLDRTRVRSHFETRVMGQPEAVDAVIDLVTLVKAGLTDPGKPFGVLLFVGPTGVGKTELARALAELLFGDPARMVRIDMSEYATYEAYERLIGQGANPGLLTATVRERPFAVLLFDEIEKAHFNVFDLCLQIFDAGRLTDVQGRTADFRRTIIVLTSNVGSTVATDTPLGFGRGAPPPPDPQLTMRELARAFRPEFLNRIDRIVNFRPLSAETAERIARREVSRVLERSGITRRRLMVDVDPGLMPLLLREGYSPAYGARPLKRTVERMVLLPVARAIASGEAVPGSILRLVARSNRVDVEVAPPESPDVREKLSLPPRLPALIQQTQQLSAQLARLRDRAVPLSGRKSTLLDQLAASDAWENRPLAETKADEVYRIDGILAGLDRLGRELGLLGERLDNRRLTERELPGIEDQLEALEGRAHHLERLVACRDPRDLGDALVVLTRIGPVRAGMDAVHKLGRMYLRWGERLDLAGKVLDDHCTHDPDEDTIALLITGAGTYGLLEPERGLHYLYAGRVPGTGPQRRHGEREVVRVEVFPAGSGVDAFEREALEVDLRSLTGVQGRLLSRPRFEVHLSHRESLTTLRAWTDCPRHEIVEHLRPLLRVRVQGAQDGTPGGVVRRYTFGSAPLVRDTRSGKTTGRLEEVLEGNLDLFLTSLEQAETS